MNSEQGFLGLKKFKEPIYSDLLNHFENFLWSIICANEMRHTKKRQHFQCDQIWLFYDLRGNPSLNYKIWPFKYPDIV